MAKPTRRAEILSAAARVVRRDGATHLTLDSVAAEAQTSKGGLLYHFSTKEALIAAMVDQMVASFDAEQASQAADDPTTPGRRTRAYVSATVSPAGPSEDDMTATALLAAVAENPDIVAPLREGYARWRRALEDDGLAPEDALLAALASDGMWLADVLGFAPLAGPLRARVVERILGLTRSEGRA